MSKDQVEKYLEEKAKQAVAPYKPVWERMADYNAKENPQPGAEKHLFISDENSKDPVDFTRQIMLGRQFERSEIENILAPKASRSEKKTRISVLPLDLLAEFVAPAYEEGIDKYERESWRKGFLVSEMVDACFRHIVAFFWDGEDLDPEPSALKHKKHHLGAAVFCLLSILWTLKTRPELDDRPNKKPAAAFKPGI